MLHLGWGKIMTHEDFLKGELKGCVETMNFIIEHWKENNDNSYNEFLAGQLKVCRANIVRSLNQLYPEDS